MVGKRRREKGGEHEQQVFFFIDISCASLNHYLAAAEAAPTSMVLASGFCPSLPQPRPDHDPRARLDLVHLQAWLGSDFGVGRHLLSADAGTHSIHAERPSI
jgi:hypothetical protein